MNNSVTPEMLRQLKADLQSVLNANAPQSAVPVRPALKATPRLSKSGKGVPETPEEIAKVRSALAHLSPDSLRGNGKLYEPGEDKVASNYWLLVVWAIASLGWRGGELIARSWSQQSGRYTEDGFDDAWDAYDPSRSDSIGIGSLYRLAMEHGWQVLNPQRVFTPQGAANTDRYRVWSADSIRGLPPMQWRVKNVLPAAGLAAIFGPSGSGKSFLALNLAAAIAHGTPWFGSRVDQANVIYVMLEGEAGIRNRIAALEEAQGKLPTESFGVVLEQFHLTTDQDVADLASVIPPGAVVFIDTLNRAAPTSDENSSKEMGLILEATKQLQVRTGGLVVVVHHTGKDSSRGMRGHSSLHAALDAAIEVERGAAGTRQWAVAKSKDGEDGRKVAFKLRVHALGHDADGDEITSCSVEPDYSAIFAKPEPKGAQQRLALKTIRDALAGVQASTSITNSLVGVKCLSVEGAIDAVSASLITTAANKRRSEARRVVKALILSGHLASCSDDKGVAFCWLD